MKKILRVATTSALFAGAFLPSVLAAQTEQLSATTQGSGAKEPKIGKDGKPKPVKAARGPAMFFNATGEGPLEVTLKTNMKRIRGDKGDEAPWRQGTLSYSSLDGKQVTIPVQLKTRGIWRRKN